MKAAAAGAAAGRESRTMLKRLLWLLPLLILAGGAYVYTSGTPLPWLTPAGEPAAPAKAAGGGRERPPKAVSIAPVETATLTDRLTATGTVRARESIVVTAEASGRVADLPFEHGASVEKGAVLVRLDDAEARAEVAAAQAELTSAQRAYDRAAQLRRNGTIAQGPFDDAQAALEQARTGLALAEESLRKRTIRAPFAGRVGFREVSPGAYLTPGEAITTLDDVARVYVDFTVPEGRLDEVAPGQTVRLTTAARPESPLDGTVTTVAPRVDPVSRQVRVRAEVPNGDGRLRPGQLARIAVAVSERPAILVPSSAVVAIGYQHFAFVVAGDDTVERRTVEIGTRLPDRVEVVEGLSEGERLVVEGAAKLNGGDRVRAVAPVAVESAAVPADS